MELKLETKYCQGPLHKGQTVTGEKWHGKCCRECWNFKMKEKRKRTDRERGECICCEAKNVNVIDGFCLKCRNIIKTYGYGMTHVERVYRYCDKNGRPVFT